MRAALLAIPLVFLAACGTWNEVADRGETPVAERTVEATATATVPDIFGTKYDFSLKTRIDDMASKADCGGLHDEFDAAEEANESTITRTGSGTLDLRSYINSKIRETRC